ncbi:F-box domain protein [Ditylenchus destructor]|uniref:F-box domain protein n=1 Tax=Ditylenchus destructor TaxID=166010 RepID=A0AAD4N430_9BILA|nr:F-box domain protein [Ditylenchus destructor]
MNIYTWNNASKFTEEKAQLRAAIVDNGQPPPLPRSPPPPLTPPTCSPVLSRGGSEKDVEELCSRFPTSVTSDNSPPRVWRSATIGCDLVSMADTPSEASTSIRYERRSPNGIEVELLDSPDRNVAEENFFDHLPWHIMYKIFTTLEIKQRIHASMVCKRWYSLLTDGRFPLDDVAVLNIFERAALDKIQTNIHGGRVQCVKLLNPDQLSNFLVHCSVISSVKLWFESTKFVKYALEQLKNCNVRMRTVDIYPYSDDVGIEHLEEYIPNVTGITMRPHASKFFFSGISLDRFPNFSKLETLRLDSISLGEETRLPESINTLEWQNRNFDEFRKFLPKLEKLPELENLIIGHAEFCGDDFNNFIQLIQSRRMKHLKYLIFKLAKLENFGLTSLQQDAELASLEYLKFDLCYGSLRLMASPFFNLSCHALKNLSVNIISDDWENETGATEAALADIFGCISRRLFLRKISLHFGLLQRYSEPSEPPPNRNYTQTTYEFKQVLSKFEASFVQDLSLLRSIFSPSSYYPQLSEIKFINALITDELLGIISTNCPLLRKLSLLDCKDCCDIGVRHFVETFNSRTSHILKIVWRRVVQGEQYKGPDYFFKTLKTDCGHLLKGLRYCSMSKVFSEGNKGEVILIWSKNKQLYIQDFDEFDRSRILGFIVPGL